jgi:hypothetical protein
VNNARDPTKRRRSRRLLATAEVEWRAPMDRLLIIGALFVLAGLCKIGGGYLVWG